MINFELIESNSRFIIYYTKQSSSTKNTLAQYGKN